MEQRLVSRLDKMSRREYQTERTKTSVWTKCPDVDRRDRGLGKQTIAMAVMFLLMVFILAGVIAKSVVPQKDLRNEAEIPANTATGPAVNTSTATGVAVLGEETGSEEVPSDNNKALDVDTTGLSSFLGFMSDSAFEDLENQLTVLCQNRGCKSAKKLIYQQTKNRFDVTQAGKFASEEYE